MSRPSVSVVMPAYNHEKYVGEAIESVLNQSFRDFEFIIVNDGSTDRTEEVIRKFRDTRIIYKFQKNSDAFNAINAGLDQARGDYFTIINSDDVYHPERLEKLLEAMRQQQAVFGFSRLELIDSNSKKVNHPEHPLIKLLTKLTGVLKQAGSLKQTMLTGNMAITTSNMILSRRLVDAVGTFKPYRYAHDYDFILRTLAAFPDSIVYQPEPLLSYRVHGRNTITENPAKVDIETFKVLMMNLPSLMCCLEDRATAEAFQDQVNRMNYVMEDADAMLTKVFNSRSWKLTAPLRYVAELMGVRPPQ